MTRLAILISIIVSLALASCQQSPFEVAGSVSDAANLSVYLDKVEPLQGTNSIVARGTADGSGDFSIPMEEVPGAGLYRVRVGAKSVYLPLDGTEKKISLSGSLKDISTYDYGISGSTLASDYQNQMKKRITSQIGSKELGEYLTSSAHPLVAALVSTEVLMTLLYMQQLAVIFLELIRTCLWQKIIKLSQVHKKHS